MPFSRRGAAGLCGVVLSLALSAQTVPAKINYQGRLTDNAPSPAPVTATVNMSFEIWDVASGGTAGVNRLWVEPASGTVPVSVTGGIFSVMLGGNGVPLPASLFTGAPTRWLQIVANGETLVPRQALAAAAYANQAQSAASATSAADSAALGGVAASGWQKATTQTCASGSFLQSIAPGGATTCASPGGTLTPPVVISGTSGGDLLSVTNNGGGTGAYIVNNSATGASPALSAFTNTPTGPVASLYSFSGSATGDGLAVTVNGSGSGVNALANGGGLAVNAVTSGTRAIYARGGAGSGAGGGYGGAIVGDGENGYGVVAISKTASAGVFRVQNLASTSPAIDALNSGSGPVGTFQITSATNANAAITAATSGTGNGVVGVSGIGSGIATGYNHTGVLGDSDSGYGVVGGSRTGTAGQFQINNALNGSAAVYATTSGTGSALALNLSNSSSTAAGMIATNAGNGSSVYAATTGGGRAGEFHGDNAGSSSDVVSVYGAGTGDVVNGYAQGTSGRAGYFAVSNGSNASPAVYAYTPGSGAGVDASSTGGDGVRGVSGLAGGAGVHGTASASGIFVSSSGVLGDTTAAGGSGVHGKATNGGSGVWGESDSGLGVYGYTNSPSANSAGGYFANSNGYSVQAETTFGTVGSGGTAVIRAMANNSTNLFIGCIGSRSSCSNRFRVNESGTVYANGGFVGSGADVAEFFAADDDPRPGDVVEIDPDHDGKFRKSSRALSTSVAGVVTTRPGLTMNAERAADGESAGPALALVGRVPVKVTAANGAIRRGDLLVASPVVGRAMKAPANPPPGTILGKAMGELPAGEGVVEMLVMLR